MYHLLDKYSKGSNRLSTNLFHVLRRIKFKDPKLCSVTEEKQRHARKLILMCDNASENKCNEMLQFYSELILVNGL